MNLFKRKQPRLPIVNITDLPAKEIHYCIVHGCELQEIGIVGDVEYDIACIILYVGISDTLGNHTM